MYIVITDDDVPGYETSSDWTPKLYDYQQTGANVLFFTFINPDTMEVPKAFANLARTRGTGGDGAIPDDTGRLGLIMTGGQCSTRKLI